MFSARLFLNVPVVLSENWDLNDLSLPLAPKLPRLPELSEPLRRMVEGPLPLSFKSASSKTHNKVMNDDEFVYLSFLIIFVFVLFFLFVFFFFCFAKKGKTFLLLKDALDLILSLLVFEFQLCRHIA